MPRNSVISAFSPAPARNGILENMSPSDKFRWKVEHLSLARVEVARGEYVPMGAALVRPLPPAWEVVGGEENDMLVMAVNGELGLRVFCSVARERDGRLWMHVSVSHPEHIPTHAEMSRVKADFLGDDTFAYAVFPPADRHVNDHGRCLHLWHCLEADKDAAFTQEHTRRAFFMDSTRGVITPDFRKGGTL